ncbi:uncharacterized protein LOC120135236 [Hibiscus syriacus]|uniref:uncharacterized protein LOC120135236 n=1 Tax=Hibiscus syriacus TaxID=106335 RepID=UPI0019208E6E|nr:uncharacterized protein LOC120135236 [Hibiscus syriacus]
MANAPGNHQQGVNHSLPSFNEAHLHSGNPVVGSSLLHNPCISLEWSSEEQAVLEEGLRVFALDPSTVRYAKIAMHLPHKTVRDVALRCRWMTKKRSDKRRKEEVNLTRKGKAKKERVVGSSADPTHFAGQSSVSQNPTPMAPKDYNDCIPFEAIGRVASELLQQNAQALNQMSANLASYELEENIVLLSQTRDNILKLLNLMNEDVPDIMKQMPQLPVKMNLELANTIFPPPPPMP